MTIRPILAAVLGLALGNSARCADFNGDGMQDLLWRNHAGAAVIWQMNGLAVGSRTTLSPALDSGSAIVASGDFFGGGSGGILWADSTNRLSLWHVANGSVQQACVVAGSIDPGWRFLGAGDVNADGRDDVAWRAPGGSVNVYLMNGCTVQQTITLAATAGTDWTFLGIGKVDTHSDSALFWREANGDVVLWRVHNGTGILSTTLAAGAYASWTVAAVADFDGDANSDLLWRSGNQTALWLMNGTKYTSATVAPAGASTFAAADTIFDGDFDEASQPARPLSASWTIIGATDVDADGRADVVLADTAGNVAIWKMDGTAIQASGLLPASGEMPYTALTGWRMAMDRPIVTKVNNQVTVEWSPVSGAPLYTVYASASNDPATSGIPITSADTTLSFGRNDAGYADKRYFAVSAGYLGVQLPPSPEAYIVEFTPTLLYTWNSMAIADINGDGCLDVLSTYGDCHGGFSYISPYAMGLSVLMSPDEYRRDIRFADFDGDGIPDLVSDVYTSIDTTTATARFFRGTGNGNFVEDSAFTALGIRGWGETIVVADFNNDGYLDIFMPQYSFSSPDEHSWLLLNDGTGHFTDVADTAGVALRNLPSCTRPEGAQAVDIDSDGRIDLYVASHLFLNAGNNAQGVPSFNDLGPVIDANCNVLTPSPVGLPQFIDEGAKFIDFDNSGQLTLVLNGTISPPGVKILRFDGVSQFVDEPAFPDIFMNSVWGLTAADVDGDGLTDLVLAGGCDAEFFSGTQIDPNCLVIGNPHALPRLLVNRGGHFVLHDFFDDGLLPTQRGWNDLQGWGDFDASGTADFITLSKGGDNSGFTSLIAKARSSDTILIRLTGAHGEQNQAGRVVRVSPVLRPQVTMTQVVDGGSGYLSNGPYDLIFATPYAGAYTVSVRFATAAYTVTAHRGDRLAIRSDGTYTTW